jgi:pyrroloquinoline quinone biosynthesis protein B
LNGPPAGGPFFLLTIIILGSAAGGGFPQWNCNCAHCAAVRAGRPGYRARTQSSIAVGGPDDWVLVNASPDVLQQVRQTPALQPARALRDSGIVGVVLCDAQVDHTTGLYMLRERRGALPLWCSDPVYEDLTDGNPLLGVLGHYCGVERHRIPLDGSAFAVPKVGGVTIRALPLASKPPPYSPRRERPTEGDNLGLVFEAASGRRAFYAPGLERIDAQVWEAMTSADIVLVDGTFWTDDEMVALGISAKRGSQIGHLAQSGDGGMLSWLARLPAKTRKVLIHINNTNPILDENSLQRRECERLGVDVAFDGMELEL